jgi:hypothetical protein
VIDRAGEQELPGVIHDLLDEVMEFSATGGVGSIERRLADVDANLVGDGLHADAVADQVPAPGSDDYCKDRSEELPVAGWEQQAFF